MSELGVDCEEIRMTEMKVGIRKLKRRKAARPCEAPGELFKEMDDGNLETVRGNLNRWLSGPGWCSISGRGIRGI